MSTLPAPRRRALRAASTATLPPPTTTTRLPREVGRLAELDRAQEAEAADDAVQVLARDAQADRVRRAGREQDGVEAVAPRSSSRSSTRVSTAISTPSVGDVRDVALDDLGREPVGGNREAHHPARHRRGLEDLHARSPARASCQAAVRPAGPEPTTATRLPFGPAAASTPGPSCSRSACRRRTASGAGSARAPRGSRACTRPRRARSRRGRGCRRAASPRGRGRTPSRTRRCGRATT